MTNGPVIKDSGNRRDFGTGAVRDMGENKGRFDLLPYYALEALARHFEAGCKKYGDRNWEQGIPLREYISSASRHLAKTAQGWTDEPHAEAAAWNIMCFLHTRRMIELGFLPPELADGLAKSFDPDKPPPQAGPGQTVVTANRAIEQGEPVCHCEPIHTVEGFLSTVRAQGHDMPVEQAERIVAGLNLMVENINQYYLDQILGIINHGERERPASTGRSEQALHTRAELGETGA